eukprot:6117801-Amphidinium_carterae.1
MQPRALHQVDGKPVCGSHASWQTGLSKKSSTRRPVQPGAGCCKWRRTSARPLWCRDIHVCVCLRRRRQSSIHGCPLTVQKRRLGATLGFATGPNHGEFVFGRDSRARPDLGSRVFAGASNPQIRLASQQPSKACDCTYRDICKEEFELRRCRPRLEYRLCWLPHRLFRKGSKLFLYLVEF